LVASIAIGACGSGASRATTNRGAATPPTQAASASTGIRAAGGDGSAERPYLLCHANGGPERTDYAFVASQRCADGSMPLGGDPARGAAARLGNVGAGPDGHIVDLYEIPCPRSPVRIHVDGYHCEGMSTEIDMNNLTRAQLANMARTIREMHQAPTDPRAHAFRRELLVWSLQTTQLTVVLCPTVFALLPSSETAGRPFHTELLLSYVAAIIEDGGDPAEPVSTTRRALEGLAVYYEASLREDPSVRDAGLDQLLASARAGGLEQIARAAITQCPDTSGMGLHR
jgi:hypothetical protein